MIVWMEHISIRAVWTEYWLPIPSQNVTYMGGHISTQRCVYSFTLSMMQFPCPHEIADLFD